MQKGAKTNNNKFKGIQAVMTNSFNPSVNSSSFKKPRQYRLASPAGLNFKIVKSKKRNESSVKKLGKTATQLSLVNSSFSAKNSN